MSTKKFSESGEDEVTLMMMDLLSMLTIVGVIMSIAMAVIMDMIPEPQRTSDFIIGDIESVFANRTYFTSSGLPETGSSRMAFVNFEIYPDEDPDHYRYKLVRDRQEQIDLRKGWRFDPEFYFDTAKQLPGTERYEFQRLFFGKLSQGGTIAKDNMILMTTTSLAGSVTRGDTIEVFFSCKLYAQQEREFYFQYTLGTDSTRFTEDSTTVQEQARKLLSDLGLSVLRK